ncbi:MAG: T9SS type A sorting domain-containing protein [Salibacteraceae bacterium]
MNKVFAISLFLTYTLFSFGQVLTPIIVESSIKLKPSKNGQLAAVGSLIFSEDFESTGNGFPYNSITSTSKSAETFKRGDSVDASTGSVFKVPATSLFAYTNDDVCNCDKSADELILPPISFNGTDGAILRFDVYFNRSFSKEEARIYVEAGANNWVDFGQLGSSGQWQSYEILIAGAAIVNPRIKFVYSDSGSWASGLALDNVELYNTSSLHDIRLDSVKVNGQQPFEFYEQIPRNQAPGLPLRLEVKASNISQVPTVGVELISEITGQQNGIIKTNIGNLDSLSSVEDTTFLNTLLASGEGTYNLLSYFNSTTADNDKTNDTNSFSIEVTDTVYSRTSDSAASKGFWFGPNQNYRIFSLFEIAAQDTATSISVYLHEDTQVGDSIDVLIYSEFLQDVVKDTFPQINEKIILTAAHIGSWVSFNIPRTGLTPGKYYVGIRARGKKVIVGVNDKPVKEGLAIASYGKPFGPVDYMPFVKLNLKGSKCNPFSVSKSITKPNCNTNNGQIVLSTSGGVAPYKYQWGSRANYSKLNAINGIRSQVYSVTITDKLGCSYTESIALSDTVSLTISLDSIRHEKCFGDSAGYIELSASGGIAPYQFVWFDGVVGGQRSNLVSGVRKVVVSDASTNGCVVFGSYDVLGPKETLKNNNSLTHNLCFSDTVGSIFNSSKGGFGSYNYVWSDNSLSGFFVQNLATGIYLVTVSDANGCSIIDTAEVLGADSLGLAGMAYDTSATGSIVTTVIGGSPSYSYFWEGPAGSGFANPGTPDIVGLIDRGIYELTVIDSLGCEVEDTFVIAGVVSVTEIDTKGSYVLFPNPSNGSIQISDSGEQLSSLIVIDQNGRVIRDITNYQGEEIRLPDGIYYLRLLDKKGDYLVTLKAIIIP